MPGKSAQDASRYIVLSRREGEAGQGNHGIAAPVAEPVIAGDDGLLISAGNDVLICSRSERRRKIVLNRAGNSGISATCDLGLPMLDDFRDVPFFGRRNDRCLSTNPEIESQGQGIEQVLREIKPAFALGIVLEVAVPVGGSFQFSRVVS